MFYRVNREFSMKRCVIYCPLEAFPFSYKNTFIANVERAVFTSSLLMSLWTTHKESRQYTLRVLSADYRVFDCKCSWDQRLNVSSEARKSSIINFSQPFYDRPLRTLVNFRNQTPLTGANRGLRSFAQAKSYWA
jgi:hypothetical protein